MELITINFQPMAIGMTFIFVVLAAGLYLIATK